MIFRKRYLIIIFIIIIQILLYTNNNQKSSFRYFKWTLQEVSIGKLISISFFSGLFISTFLNNTVSNNTKKSYENKNTYENKDKNFEPIPDDEPMKSDVEIPPQRDIRDAQPTISVNYRVVRNTDEKNMNRDQDFSNSPYDKDDWVNDNNDNDW